MNDKDILKLLLLWYTYDPFCVYFKYIALFQTKERSPVSTKYDNLIPIPSPSHTKALCSLKLTWLSP